MEEIFPLFGQVEVAQLLEEEVAAMHSNVEMVKQSIGEVVQEIYGQQLAVVDFAVEITDYSLRQVRLVMFFVDFFLHCIAK